MRSISRISRAAAAALACAGCVAGCTTTMTGTPRAISASDSGAPTVTPAELGKLLVDDAAISDLVGRPGLVTYRNYSEIVQPSGEAYNEPACAETFYNTMWTAYNGVGHTGTAGRKLQPTDKKVPYQVDEGVVSLPSADAATRFVIRTVMGWDRCGDHHLSERDPGPDERPEFFTLGFTKMSGDIATVVNSLEGGEDLTNAHAIVARSNVVIDVYVVGEKVTATQPVALVNAIAAKMPH